LTVPLRRHAKGGPAAIDKSQACVTGTVRLNLYKGNVAVVGRESRYSLYDQW
jgi:argininosuccinate synthase